MQTDPLAGRAFAAATGVGPLIAVPLAQIGSARGVMVVARTANSPPFGPADISLVSTFAAQAASAIELFELRTAERGVEVVAERQRIARELHDGVVSALRDLQAGVRGLADGMDDPRLAAGIAEAIAQAGFSHRDDRRLRRRAPGADAAGRPGRGQPCPCHGRTRTSDTARRPASHEGPRQLTERSPSSVSSPGRPPGTRPPTTSSRRWSVRSWNALTPVSPWLER